MSRPRVHKFSDPEPTTTGSHRRAYRKNLRCDKSHGIRTDRLFSAENKVLHGLPLRPEDYLRNIYKRLKARFDPQLRLPL